MTTVARGAAIFAGTSVQGRLRRFVSPDDVIAMLDEGEAATGDVIALVDDAGATFLAPIEADLAGIVCRSGDIESHLAIVSRDFRIPALMNVRFDGDEPPDGSLVEIDCDAATLSLVEEHP